MTTRETDRVSFGERNVPVKTRYRCLDFLDSVRKIFWRITIMCRISQCVYFRNFNNIGLDQIHTHTHTLAPRTHAHPLPTHTHTVSHTHTHTLFQKEIGNTIIYV